MPDALFEDAPAAAGDRFDVAILALFKILLIFRLDPSSANALSDNGNAMR